MHMLSETLSAPPDPTGSLEPYLYAPPLASVCFAPNCLHGDSVHSEDSLRLGELLWVRGTCRFPFSIRRHHHWCRSGKGQLPCPILITLWVRLGGHLSPKDARSPIGTAPSLMCFLTLWQLSPGSPSLRNHLHPNVHPMVHFYEEPDLKQKFRQLETCAPLLHCAVCVFKPIKI